MWLFYIPSADRWAWLAKALSISRKAKVNTVSKFFSLGSKSLCGEEKRAPKQSFYNRFLWSQSLCLPPFFPHWTPVPSSIQEDEKLHMVKILFCHMSLHFWTPTIVWTSTILIGENKWFKVSALNAFPHSHQPSKVTFSKVLDPELVQELKRARSSCEALIMSLSWIGITASCGLSS